MRIGHASIDENGAAHGGKPGDQNGREVCVREYYTHKKGWRVLRAPDARQADGLATAMERACANAHIGYDQYRRDTLLACVKDRGYDPGLADRDVCCDCSSLVRVCLAYARGSDDVARATNGRFSTATMTAVLKKLGFTEPQGIRLPGELLRGDILVTKTQGHTVIALDDGTEAPPRPDEGGTCPYREPEGLLKRGARGNGVRWLQWHLSVLYDGTCPRERVDGIFGGKTQKALRVYQASRGLAADGIAGPVTRACLKKEAAEGGKEDE